MISSLIWEQREQMSSCTNASPRPRLIHNQILMAQEIQFTFLVFEDIRRVILETGENQGCNFLPQTHTVIKMSKCLQLDTSRDTFYNGTLLRSS